MNKKKRRRARPGEVRISRQAAKVITSAVFAAMAEAVTGGSVAGFGRSASKNRTARQLRNPSRSMDCKMLPQCRPSLMPSLRVAGGCPVVMCSAPCHARRAQPVPKRSGTATDHGFYPSLPRLELSTRIRRGSETRPFRPRRGLNDFSPVFARIPALRRDVPRPFGALTC